MQKLVDAPPHWRVIDFISDLHLSPTEPKTLALWQRYLTQTRADALFILGDLLEVWIGDDALDASSLAQTPAQNGLADSFELRCQASLQLVAQRLPVYFLHGNRDFLLGAQFASRAGITLLHDPCVLALGQQRFLLSHGDELCTDDLPYQAFRKEVRSAAWQQQFLARPLPERRAIARQLRAQSEAQKMPGMVYADVNTTAALVWLRQHQCVDLIHGHTHRPGSAPLVTESPKLLVGSDPGQHLRHVLSDWDASASPARAEVFRLTQAPGDAGFEASRLAPALA